MTPAPKWLRDLMATAERSIPRGAARREWVIAAAQDLIDIPGIAEPVEDAAIEALIEAVWAALYSPAAKARRAKRQAARVVKRAERKADRGRVA